MSTFAIASVVMKIVDDENDQFTSLADFAVDGSTPADITVFVKPCASIEKPQSGILINEGIMWVHNRDACNMFSLYVCTESTGEPVFKVDIASDWKEAVVYYLKNKLDGEYALTGPVGEVLFRTILLFRKGLCIHASALICENKGIIFAAPSGTGKTTQSEMWKSFKNARIINGDRAALGICDKTPFVYGSPWSGSSGAFSNSSAPLEAVIVLEQAQANELHRLDSKVAVSMLLPRCFLPYFDERLMTLAINNLSSIIASTPVYLLKCRPDKEAVELVYKCLL